MKPMLAAATAATSLLRFPVMVSPKLDGVRCLIINGKAMSRSLKPIPNEYVQALLSDKRFNGLDGELVVGPAHAKDVYRRTTSGVMSVEGRPDFSFLVFDNYLVPGGYDERHANIHSHMAARQPWCAPIQHHWVNDEKQLLKLEHEFLAEGFEGVMIRDPGGPYKYGRSTEKEGWLLKLKRFKDGEALILGMTALMHNQNEAKRNALGHLERSSHKANKVADRKRMGTMGVQDLRTGVTFDIGTGFTDAEREQFWRDRAKLMNKAVVKYKYQPTGVKDKPRFPVFLGFRDRRDM